MCLGIHINASVRQKIMQVQRKTPAKEHVTLLVNDYDAWQALLTSCADTMTPQNKATQPPTFLLVLENLSPVN